MVSTVVALHGPWCDTRETIDDAQAGIGGWLSTAVELSTERPPLLAEAAFKC